MNKAKAQVRDVFATKIAIIADFLESVDVSAKIKKSVRKQIWRIYDNIAQFRCVSDCKVTEIFNIRIGMTLQLLEEESCPPNIKNIVRQYMWSIAKDLELMSGNIEFPAQNLIVNNEGKDDNHLV
jgi:uncharacterized protein (UPF0147 family)